MKLKTIALLAALCFSTQSYATATVSVSPIDTKVEMDDEAGANLCANYDYYIKNNSGYIETYFIVGSLTGANKSISYFNDQMTLNGGQSITKNKYFCINTIFRRSGNFPLKAEMLIKNAKGYTEAYQAKIATIQVHT